jgi:surface carbohydrate biosynthesis protein
LIKKTIYICIELKNRELNTVMMLAAKAALKGYRVYFGSHASIFTLLKTLSIKNGIIIEKSTQPENLLRFYSEKIEHIVVMDIELTPIINDKYAEVMLKNRLYPGSPAYISKFVCLSPQIEKAAKEVLRQDQLIHIPWLKSELWERYFPLIYKPEVEKIKNKFSNYLLFVSGFRYLEDPASREHFPSAGVIVKNEKNSLQYKMRNHLNYVSALATLTSWDKDENVPIILVRPHPSEDVRIWKQALSQFKKTFLVTGNDIAPWILASSGVIHAGSTATLEATLASKDLFYLRDCSIIERHELSDRLSPFIVDKITPPILSKFEVMKNDRFDRVFAESIYAKNTSPSDSLIRTFSDLEITAVKRSNVVKFNTQLLMFRSMRRALGLIRDEFSWKLKTTNIPPQSFNIPHTIRKRDIRKLLDAEVAFRNIKSRHIGINLWEFDSLR